MSDPIRFNNTLLAAAASHRLYQAQVPHERCGCEIKLAEGYDLAAGRVLREADAELGSETAKVLHKQFSTVDGFTEWSNELWNQFAEMVRPRGGMDTATKLPGWSDAVFAGAFAKLVAWLMKGGQMPDHIEHVVKILGGDPEGRSSLALLHVAGYLTVVPPAKTKKADVLFWRPVRGGKIDKPPKGLRSAETADPKLAYWKGSNVFASPALAEIAKFLLDNGIKVKVPTDTEEAVHVKQPSIEEEMQNVLELEWPEAGSTLKITLGAEQAEKVKQLLSKHGNPQKIGVS